MEGMATLAKNGKKDSEFLDFPMRCEICGTTLTLYPKDFMPCPHCHRKVCRQCWAGAWSAKSFSGEDCSHIPEEEGRNVMAVSGIRKGMRWDWQRAVFVAILVVLMAGILYFLFTFFIF
jgi:ribosomal protein S14